MNYLTRDIIANLNTEVSDNRVIDFLDNVISDLNNKKIDINDYVKIILNLLLTQLILYYKAADNIFAKNEVSSEDSYKRKSKAPEISIMQKSHDQILNLLDKITLSPLASAKVKKLNSGDSEQSAQEYLDTLVG